MLARGRALDRPRGSLYSPATQLAPLLPAVERGLPVFHLRALTAAFGLLSLALVGCAPEPGKPQAAVGDASLANPSARTPAAVSPIAVIDLDAIARQLGRDRQMLAAIERHESSLNQQLQVVQANYQKELEQRRQEMTSGPATLPLAERQQHLLARFQEQAGGEVQQLRQQAKREMDRHRLQVIQDFREEVRPIAREVALARNLSLIVTKNDAVVFDYVSSIDITQEVVARMQSPPGPAAR